MTKPFKNLRDKMSPQARKASEEKAKKMRMDYPKEDQVVPTKESTKSGGNADDLYNEHVEL